MTQEELREQFIEHFADMMRYTPFSVEYKAKKRPEGIKITIEVTQEEMDAIASRMSK